MQMPAGMEASGGCFMTVTHANKHTGIDRLNPSVSLSSEGALDRRQLEHKFDNHDYSSTCDER